MLDNYIRSAFRVHWKSRTESAINLIGLTAGLAAVILIGLFIRDELSYDGWWPGGERIYTVETSFTFPGREGLDYAVSSGPIAPAITEDFPADVAAASRLYIEGGTLSIGDKRFKEGIGFVDANFFQVFDLKMVIGDRAAALRDNSSILLSQTMAEKYFGQTDPLGAILTFNGNTDYRVAGVFEDFPPNSHLAVDFIGLINPARYEDQNWVLESWFSPNLYTYLLLNDGVTTESLLARFPEFLNRRMSGPFFGQRDAEASDFMALHLLAMPDIHLHSTRPYNIKPVGSITTVYTFASVALLILLTACINYINLSTARATNRAPEIAMRKVLGAHRRQLLVQFVTESVLVMMVALFLALGAVQMALPGFNSFLGKEIELAFSDPLLSLALPAFTAFIGVLAGLYPALYLSAFRPSRVLTANRSESGMAGRFRNILVVLQFSVAIGLILSTVIVYNQTRFAQTMDLGYEKAGKIIVRGLNGDQAKDKAVAFEQEVEKLPGVRRAALADHLLPRRGNNRRNFYGPGGSRNNLILIDAMTVDFEYFEVYEINPLAGRIFQRQHSTDKLEIPEELDNTTVNSGAVVNASAALKLGLGKPENAVGKVFYMTLQNNSLVAFEVIGVVGDVNTHSAHFPAPPVVFMIEGKVWSGLVVAVEAGALESVGKAIDKIWAGMVPEIPITRSFVAEDVDQLYADEERYGQVLAAFSVLAILISAMGLFSLSAFMAARRTKEIGIRKVLGARTHQIIRLVVWQLSKPVLLANLISWPIAAWFMADWLKGFVYRIELTPALFLVAGTAAMLVAWVTVASHTWRVARQRPINALRYE